MQGQASDLFLARFVFSSCVPSDVTLRLRDRISFSAAASTLLAS
jgi:hypothetical protein